LKICTTTWLTDKYLEAIRVDPKMSLTSFAKTVRNDWNLNPSRSKLGSAKRLAMKKVNGDEEQQYNMLWV
jgi:hypothetical protein